MRTRLLKALGPEACAELHIVGRSRKQKIMLDAEHVTERMEVAGRSYEYMQVRRVLSGFVEWVVCAGVVGAGLLALGVQQGVFRFTSMGWFGLGAGSRRGTQQGVTSTGTGDRQRAMHVPCPALSVTVCM